MDHTLARPSVRIDRAAEVAHLVHRGAVRKGTARPYILHPFAVARILEDHGYGEDLVVAGLLHDTVEDAKYDNEGFQREMCALAGGGRMPCPAALAEFRAAYLRFLDDEFGATVLELVLGVSETKNHGGPALDWLERKKEQLVHLSDASEQLAALKAADALHNIECTLTDLRELGLTVLDRFRGGALTVWHYSAIAQLVVERMPQGHPLASRVQDAADQLSATVRTLRPASPSETKYLPPTVY
jgi:(p)ppGpp synthase/HD superfamily hydrolase